jgi:hypothetical protein
MWIGKCRPHHLKGSSHPLRGQEDKMQELDLDPNPMWEAFAKAQHGEESWQAAYVEESGEELKPLFQCQGHLTPKK